MMSHTIHISMLLYFFFQWIGFRKIHDSTKEVNFPVNVCGVILFLFSPKVSLTRFRFDCVHHCRLHILQCILVNVRPRIPLFRPAAFGIH